MEYQISECWLFNAFVIYQWLQELWLETVPENIQVYETIFILKKNIFDLSLFCFVCLISSTSSRESGQVDEVAKLAKSGLFGAPVYTKSLSWHNFGQNISDISKLPSLWLSHLCLCFCEGRECCFVFVAEFQNFMAANSHISSLCSAFSCSLLYTFLHWGV